MIIPGTEPFLMQGGSHGVLLIHGFTGNAAELLLLGKYLHSKNFTVHGVRLAGHGTNEKNLLQMTKEDWLNSVVDGYSILSGICDKISIIGHSMGGLLSLRAVEMSLINVYKIVTLAAPIFIDDSRGLEHLPPREQSVGQFVREARQHLHNVPPAVNRTYRLMPLISIHELIDLLNDVKDNLRNVSKPILIVQGEDDHTVKTESANYIYDNVSSNVKELKFIKDAGHLMPIHEKFRDGVFKLVADFLGR